MSRFLPLLLLCSVSSAQAADAHLGRNLAATCANCHGTNGRAVGSIPALAGEPADVLVRKLNDFKEGKQPATVMHQLAKGYSAAQIDAVAAYFAAQPK